MNEEYEQAWAEDEAPAFDATEMNHEPAMNAVQAAAKVDGDSQAKEFSDAFNAPEAQVAEKAAQAPKPKSFKEAFSQARSKMLNDGGPNVFDFNGKKYSTDVAGTTIKQAPKIGPTTTKSVMAKPAAKEPMRAPNGVPAMEMVTKAADSRYFQADGQAKGSPARSPAKPVAAPEPKAERQVTKINAADMGKTNKLMGKV